MTKEYIAQIVKNGEYFQLICLSILYMTSWFITFKLGFRILDLNNIGFWRILPATAIMTLYTLYIKLFISDSVFVLMLVALVICLLAWIGKVGFIRAAWAGMLIFILSFLGNVIEYSLLSLNASMITFFFKTFWGIFVSSLGELLFPALALIHLRKFKHISLIPSFKKKKIDLFDIGVVFTFITMLFVVAFLTVQFYNNLKNNPLHILWDVVSVWFAAAAALLVTFVLLTVMNRRHENKQRQLEKQHELERQKFEYEQRVLEERREYERQQYEHERRMSEERIIQLQTQNMALTQLNQQLAQSYTGQEEFKGKIEEVKGSINQLVSQNSILIDQARSNTPPPQTLAGDTKPDNPDNLSESEILLVRLVAQNKSTEEIAAALYVCTSSVRKYVSNLYDKLGLKSNRVDIALYAVKHGFVKREEIVLDREEIKPDGKAINRKK